MATINVTLNLSAENEELMKRFCDSLDLLKASSQSGIDPRDIQAINEIIAAHKAAPAMAQPAVQQPAPAQPVPTAVSQEAVTPVPTAMPRPAPTAAPTYTMDQIAKAGAELAQQGRLPDLLALLQQFGVQAVTQIPEAQYGAFATALRGLGAQL